jgi:hypothetical protein
MKSPVTRDPISSSDPERVTAAKLPSSVKNKKFLGFVKVDELGWSSKVVLGNRQDILQLQPPGTFFSAGGVSRPWIGKSASWQ